MEAVAKRITDLRASVNLSQNKLSKEFGISQSALNRYEHNETSVPDDVLLKYAEFFDVSLDYIFGRTDKPEGKLYSFTPQYSEDNENFKQFIEMCFDSSSPMNEKLKQTLIDMVTKGGGVT